MSGGTVPSTRLHALNEVPVRQEGEYVLYWMVAARRLRWNFALQRAAELARERGKPLVILEILKAAYPWACDRFHRFIVDGMAETAERTAGGPVVHYPYVERAEGDADGLVEALAVRAAAVVSDDFPSFFLPAMQQGAARRLTVRMEVVDGNGLLPLRSAKREYPSAFHFRRILQKQLPDHLFFTPEADPLHEGVPRAEPGLLSREEARWPRTTVSELTAPGLLAGLPLDHDVPPAPYSGGEAAAQRVLATFVADRLERYGEGRNHPDDGACSGLSPYLHFGYVSAHEIFDAVAQHEGWNPSRLGSGGHGRRSGWWGLSESAESFLDELVTWRELGFNMNAHRSDYDRYESLPEWARETLEAHERDRRPALYDLDDLEGARTDDPLWNAAQRELVREGRIHGYLRMLWGKRILEWTPTARGALSVMIHLNDKYATDGRDPNSYSGIFWVLGRYDRPWPERPVFGRVRSMTSASARRKLRLDRYLARFGDEAQGTLFDGDAGDS